MDKSCISIGRADIEKVNKLGINKINVKEANKF